MKLNSFVLPHRNPFQRSSLTFKDENSINSNIHSAISQLRHDLGFSNLPEPPENQPLSKSNTSNSKDTLVPSAEIYRCLIQRDKIDDDTGSESEEDYDNNTCFIIYPDHPFKQIFDAIIIM